VAAVPLRRLKSANVAASWRAEPLTAAGGVEESARDADRAAKERGHEVEGRATLNGVQLPQGAPPIGSSSGSYPRLFVPSS